ncbi:MAG: hypothetical protein WAS07_08500, partial [Micropruina sp.]
IALVNLDTDSDLDLITIGATAPVVHLALPERVTRIGLAGVTVSLAPTSGAGAGGSALSITDGQGGFVIRAGGVAGTFSGQVDAAVGDFSAGISVAVRYNSTTSAVDETIEVGGVSVPVVFTAAEVATVVGVTVTPFVQISGSGTIKLGDFVEIRGSVTFGTTESTFTDVKIFLGQGPGFNDDGSVNPTAQGVAITGASGRVVTDATGNRALFATGTVILVGVPGITLSGTITVKYNETLTTQFSGVELVPAGTAVTPYALLGASNLVLKVPGVELTGAFSFELKPNGELTVRVGEAAVTGGAVSLSLGDPAEGSSAAPVVVTLSTGELTLTKAVPGGSPAGLYGVVVAGLTLNVPGITFGSGPIDLRINTTTAAQSVLGNALPANSLRVQLGTAASPVTLGFAGQQLSGVFGFEQVTGTLSPSAPPGTAAPKTIRIFATNVGLTLGTATAGVVLTNGSGFFVLTPVGLAGRVGGSVTVNVPGDVEITGTFSVAVNSTTRAVNESILVNDQTIT